jgi:hypothetical protein
MQRELSCAKGGPRYNATLEPPSHRRLKNNTPASLNASLVPRPTSTSHQPSVISQYTKVSAGGKQTRGSCVNQHLVDRIASRDDKLKSSIASYWRSRWCFALHKMSVHGMRQLPHGHDSRNFERHMAECCSDHVTSWPIQYWHVLSHCPQLDL